MLVSQSYRARLVLIPRVAQNGMLNATKSRRVGRSWASFGRCLSNLVHSGATLEDVGSESGGIGQACPKFSRIPVEIDHI